MNYLEELTRGNKLTTRLEDAAHLATACAEVDRLRAENAELVGAIEDLHLLAEGRLVAGQGNDLILRVPFAAVGRARELLEAARASRTTPTGYVKDAVMTASCSKCGAPVKMVMVQNAVPGSHTYVHTDTGAVECASRTTEGKL